MQPTRQTESGSGLPLSREQQAPVSPGTRWSAPERIAFRFGFVYFALFNLEVILHLLPFPPFTQLFWLFDMVRWNTVLWVSRHVLHVAHDFGTDYLNTTAGTKDTTYYYVQTLCYLVVAIIASLVWSWFDRKRQEYAGCHRWFLLLLRASLATALISYGAAKVFPYQFPPPALSQFIQIYGNSTRNQLLWISMGVAPTYSCFGGLVEVIAGLLLMVPQLATLGALMSSAVVGNVLMLNFGYDVGAKLLVINLAAMGLVILLPDMGKLADFFLWNRNTSAVSEKPFFRRQSLNRAILVLQVAFGILLLSYDLYRSYQLSSQIVISRNAPLSGIWAVDDYEISGQPRPAMSDNPHRWQRLIVNSTDQAQVQVMTGGVQALYLRCDPHAKSFVLTESGVPSWIAELTYDDSKPGFLVLNGKMGGLPVLIRLHREDESKFALNDHTIHWIQDVVK